MENKEEKISILSFAGHYKILTVLGCVLSGISAVMTLVPFICIWLVVRDIFAVMPDISEATNLSHYGWVAVWFSIASIIIYFAALMCTHIAAFRTARNMRSKALHHIVKLPLGYFTTQRSGKIRHIIDESSGMAETFLAHQLPDLTAAIVTPIALLVLLLSFDWRLGLLSLVPIVIGAYSMSKMMGASLAGKMQEYQNSLEDMNSEAVEYVRGIPVVKTFGQTIFSFKNFYAAIMRYKKFVVDYTLSLRTPNTIATIAVNSVFAVLIPAAILMMDGAEDYNTFLLNLIFYIIISPIVSVMMTKIMFAGEAAMTAIDAAKRVIGILNVKPLEEAVNSQKPKSSTVQFENVIFSYPESNSPAVDNVSFTVNPGETVALVGPSGGGKTTAASLIPRFFDVQTGSVKVGGIDVRNIANDDLMDMVAFVFQDTHLFKASLLDNIRQSKPNATKAEVGRAVKAARCEDIIEKLPNGLDTVVGTNGVYLSGGEAQRIALARAILKNAPIILLDEATAFADPENEYQIQLAIGELTKGKTVLMIAHRLSTVRHSDKIIVLANGKLIQQGTHDFLVTQKGLYGEMWKDYQTSVAWKVGKEAVCND